MSGFFVLDVSFLEAGVGATGSNSDKPATKKKKNLPPPPAPDTQSSTRPFSLEALRKLKNDGGTGLKRPSAADLRIADRRDTQAPGVPSKRDEDARLRALGYAQAEEEGLGHTKKKPKRDIGTVVVPWGPAGAEAPEVPPRKRTTQKPKAKKKSAPPATPESPATKPKASKKVEISAAEKQAAAKEAADTAASSAAIAMASLRSKATAHLKATLVASEGSFGFAPEDCQKVAGEVEAAVYTLYGGRLGGEGEATMPRKDEYRSKCRSLSFNLKGEPNLVSGLLLGNITPAGLAGMSIDELASQSVLKERERLRDEASRQALASSMGRDWVDTDRYTCRKCGGTACQYYQIGGKMISRKAEVGVFLLCIAWRYRPERYARFSC